MSSNVERLKQETSRIASNVKDFGDIREVLAEEVDVLKSTLKCMNTEKNALLKCADKFQSLSEGLEGTSAANSTFTQECDAMCNDLWAEYQYIKLQNEKADLLKLFYDKQGLEDDIDGLSRTEFEYLLFDLDENIKERFPPFDEFDKNDDGVIDAFEFDAVLDDIYKQLFKDMQNKAERDIGDHYKNRSKEKAIQSKQERRAAIEKEKQTKMMPLSILRSQFK